MDFDLNTIHTFEMNDSDTSGDDNNLRETMSTSFSPIRLRHDSHPRQHVYSRHDLEMCKIHL